MRRGRTPAAMRADLRAPALHAPRASDAHPGGAGGGEEQSLRAFGSLSSLHSHCEVRCTANRPLPSASARTAGLSDAAAASRRQSCSAASVADERARNPGYRLIQLNRRYPPVLVPLGVAGHEFRARDDAAGSIVRRLVNNLRVRARADGAVVGLVGIERERVVEGAVVPVVAKRLRMRTPSRQSSSRGLICMQNH